MRGLLDPADERYEAQRELSAAGALSALEILVQVCGITSGTFARAWSHTSFKLILYTQRMRPH